jgi:RNA polymerase sigma-70 factor (ECF subfamily)
MKRFSAQAEKAEKPVRDGWSSKGGRPSAKGSATRPPLRETPGREADSRPASYRVVAAVAEAGAHDEAAVSELAARAQDGDDLAFAELYIVFFDRVKRYLVVVLKDPDDANEVAQDVFERALKTLDTYDPSRGPFRAWLFRMVSSMAIDHLRRERRRKDIDPRDLPSDAVTVVERGAVLVEALDPQAGVRELVEALPESQRRAVTLRFVFDFNAAEIADVLGCSGDSVRHLQHRALKAIATGLRSRGGN